MAEQINNNLNPKKIFQMKNQTQELDATSTEKINEINQLTNRIDLQNVILNEIDSVNNMIDFVFTRDNCLVDNKSFSIMSITQY